MKTVQEALDKAERAQEKRQYFETIRQCDAALAALEKLPDDVPHKRLKAKALELKGRAIHFPRGTKEALKYYEQVLAIKKDTDSKADYAAYLKGLGAEYSNAGDEEKSAAAYQQALKVFEEIGDKGQQAEALTWLGSKPFFKDDGRKAMDLFERAMPLYLESGKGKSMAGVCRAAIELLEDVGDKPGLEALIERSAACSIVKREPTAIIRVGDPGFSKGGGGFEPWSVSVLHCASQMRPTLDLTKKVGDTWSQDVFSYTFHPLVATATFESDSETVEVLAGRFTNCWKITMVAVQSHTQAEDERDQRQIDLNKIKCGTRTVWYAPGVGLVKYKAEQESGLKATIELAAYSIQGNKESYFPLAIGSWWEYRPVGIDANIVAKQRYEVFDREENTFYLASCRYAYRGAVEQGKPPKPPAGDPDRN